MQGVCAQVSALATRTREPCVALLATVLGDGHPQQPRGRLPSTPGPDKAVNYGITSCSHILDLSDEAQAGTLDWQRSFCARRRMTGWKSYLLPA